MAKNYVTPGEAARILGVWDRTLRYWEEQGKITAIKTAGGHRRYDITTYTTGTTGDRAIILYDRVWSTKQKEDLLGWCEDLQSQYPDGELVKEVGGGLNYKRKKCLPYWSGSSQEMSNVLWSHIKTGSLDLVSICWSSFVPNTLGKSWFSKKLSFLPKEKWLKTFFQSSTVSEPDCTDSESIHLKS